jgi:dihydropyrimidinase
VRTRPKTRGTVPLLRIGWIAVCLSVSCLTTATRGSAQDLLIHDGTVVTSEGSFAADVLVLDGIIVELGQALTAPGVRRVDASGLLVLPGGVDPHVHISFSPEEDYRTGSMAALAGGITTISDFINGGGETLADRIEGAAAVIDEQALADVILHLGLNDPATQQDQMSALVTQAGQPSVKIFMRGNRFDRNVADYVSAIGAAGEAGVLTMMHAEDESILSKALEDLTAAGQTSLEYYSDSRPVLAEVVAIQRAVAIAEQTGAPIYIVHLSTERGLRVAQDAQRRGVPIFVETRPIYLHLTRERFDGPDPGLYVGEPPLREQHDQDALWAGLADGTIQTIGTDHVAYSREAKLDTSQTIGRHRAGSNNLQVLRPMLYSEGVVSGRLSVERFVAVTSTNPAKLFGIYPRKGAIAVGSDADIVLWDPEETRVIRDEDMLSGTGFSIYSGWEVTGWPTVTIRRGEIVFEDGEILAEPGSGQLLRRSAFSGI